MSEIVRRFVGASNPSPLPQADVFAGTGFIACEIEEATIKAGAAAHAICAGHAARSLQAMQTAQADLDKLLRQANTLSESLGRVLAYHANKAKTVQP